MLRLALLLCALVVVSVLAQKAPANLLPNVDALGKGFDILKGHPAMEGLRQPAYQLTYAKNKKYVYQGKTYAIPDLCTVTNDPGYAGSSSTEVHTSSQSVQKQLGLSMSVKAGSLVSDILGVFGDASLSHTYTQNYGQSLVTAYSEQKYTLWQAAVANDSTVTQQFEVDTFILPGAFNNETCERFAMYFKKYGTHIVLSAVYGGDVTMTTSFRSTYYNSSSVNTVGGDIGAIFGGVTASIGSTVSSSHQTSGSSGFYNYNVELVGGDPGLYASDASKWPSSIVTNPVPVKMFLKPIWEVCVQGGDLRPILEAATRSYVATQYGANQWHKRGSIPITFRYHGADAINGLVYTAGGKDASGDYSYDLYSYDAKNDFWKALHNMPTDRQSLVAVASGGFLYAIGGYDSLHHRDNNELYNPATNSWTSRADMISDRDYMAAVNVGDTIYVMGGHDGNALGTVEGYNPSTNKWYVYPSMPTPRWSLAAVAIGNYIYTIGGINSLGFGVPTVEIYNVVSKSWKRGAPMPSARYGLSAAVANGLIYAMGGSNGDSDLNDVEVYDPATNTWTTGVPMPTARKYFSATTVENVIYAIGGDRNGQGLNENWAFVPPIPGVPAWPCPMP